MKINEIIVVEGKTDTAILKKLFDCETIETQGLALNEQTLQLIKEASKTRGIIVLTDPDFPGNKIRNQIVQYVPDAKHAFVEKKDAIGKKKLGIAEAKEEAIIKAIENVVTFKEHGDSISWEDFLSLDIIGNKQKREEIFTKLHLGYGNNKTLFKRLNMVGYTKEDVLKALAND